MNFRVDPFDVVNTLHSILEQKNVRMTVVQAVHELAAKGLVLPGDSDKEQSQVLTALVNLCDPSFLDTRPGRGGGVGLPTMRAAKSKKAGRATVASVVRDLESQDADTEDQLETGT